MFLRRQSVLSSELEDMVRISRIAFRRGNPYLLRRDHPGSHLRRCDSCRVLSGAAYWPRRLTLVTLM